MECFIAGAEKPHHPPFNDMVLETIAALRERRGSSRQKIVKFIGENYDVGVGYERQVNQALKRGVSRGTLLQVRGTGASGSFKINKDKAGCNAAARGAARVKLLPRNQGLVTKDKPHPLVDEGGGKENKPESEEEKMKRRPRTASNKAKERIQMLANGIVSSKTAEALPVGNHKRLKQQEKEREVEEEEEEEEEEVKEEDDAYTPSEEEEESKGEESQCEEEDTLCEYERQRLRNIQQNLEFMASLNLTQAKENFHGGKKTVQFKPKNKKDSEVPEPSRRSLRLQGFTPAGTPLPPPPVTMTTPPLSQPRKPSGPLQMTCSDEDREDMERSFRESLVTALQANGASTEEREGKVGVANEGEGGVGVANKATDRAAVYSQLKLRRVAKATPQRVTTLGFHPSSTKTLVAAGDKRGNLALWDVYSHDYRCVFRYAPHSRGITGLVFPSSPSSPLLYTCSYDGTLRCANLEKGIFEEVYSVPEEQSFLSCDISRQSDWLVVGQTDGSVVQLDPRDCSGPVREWVCHRKPVKCVHVNPVDSNYIATASGDGSAAVWDCRNVKGYNSCVQRVASSRTVTSAYFSPLSGQKLLTTSLDNHICVFMLPPACGPVLRIHHNNQTGRWLTPFKAEWDPLSDDYFIIGSLTHPRQIELHCTSPHVPSIALRDMNLTTVSSPTTIHPHIPIIAGATSSGRVLLWD